MKQPTYAEQWQKITKAYLNDELEPTNSCACFVGNMLNNNRNWCWNRMFVYPETESWYAAPIDSCHPDKLDNVFEFYTMREICALETQFLKGDTNTEQGLFESMVSTLEMLKQIHKDKGQDVDEGLVLTKREKQLV